MLPLFGGREIVFSREGLYLLFIMHYIHTLEHITLTIELPQENILKLKILLKTKNSFENFCSEYGVPYIFEMLLV